MSDNNIGTKQHKHGDIRCSKWSFGDSEESKIDIMNVILEHYMHEIGRALQFWVMELISVCKANSLTCSPSWPAGGALTEAEDLKCFHQIHTEGHRSGLGTFGEEILKKIRGSALNMCTDIHSRDRSLRWGWERKEASPSLRYLKMCVWNLSLTVSHTAEYVQHFSY